MEPDRGQHAARQDQVILHPVLRAYFGPRGFYNTGYWDKRTRTQEDACVRLMEVIARRMPADAARIADVGCGLGAGTAELERLFPPAGVFGANISHVQCFESRRRASRAKFVQMDGAAMAFRTASLDAVASVESVLFFRTRRAFYQEAARILRPRGVVAVTDMLFTSPSWNKAWHAPDENYIPSIGAYRTLLSECGFEGIKLEDATRPCWQSHWEHFRQWVDARQRRGDMAADEAKRWRDQARRFADEAVSHYVIVTAVRG